MSDYSVHHKGFEPDIQGCLVVPVHPANVISGANEPKVIVLHTPEEPADEYESTPRFFAEAPRDASTHYYADNDGDLYQLLPEHHPAIANGVKGKPYPAGTSPSVSLNRQSVNIEIEGYADGMHRTCKANSRQWETVRNWIISCALRHKIPIDRKHVIGHREVADDRGDPGSLDIDKLVAQAAEYAEKFAAAPTEAQVNNRIRSSLARAWTKSEWQMLHKQLHYLRVGTGE